MSSATEALRHQHRGQRGLCICYQRPSFSASYKTWILEDTRPIRRPDHAQYWRKGKYMYWCERSSANTCFKTNPGPLGMRYHLLSRVMLIFRTETILVQDPHIQSALMFGRGRFNAGILIDPTPSDVFDPRDEDQLAAYRNKIWFVFTMNVSVSFAYTSF